MMAPAKKQTGSPSHVRRGVSPAVARLEWSMRSFIRFGVGFILFALAVVGISPPALGDPCPGDVRFPLSYAIHPERPCDGDSVFLTVSACGPCVDLITVGDYLGVEVVA